jgi:hypothetical protein
MPYKAAAKEQRKKAPPFRRRMDRESPTPFATHVIHFDILRDSNLFLKSCPDNVVPMLPMDLSLVPSARNRLSIPVPVVESPGCIPSPLRGDSPDYRERYADNLSKELPRIPCVKKAADFWAFSKAGRDLAELHIGYEKVDMYPVTIDGPTRAQQAAPLRESHSHESSVQKTSLRESPSVRADVGAPLAAPIGDRQIFRVEKIRYAKIKVNGKSVDDKTTLIYNEHITLKDIPLEAYEYVVNGKSALDWIVERQCVKTDKDSGIVNDANAWAVETMGNAKYPLELFMRVITVSLETMKIVKELPGLTIG